MHDSNTNSMSCSQSEFEDWVDRYTPELYSFALKLLSDAELAKDTLQECFLAALQNFDKFNRESHIKTWLFSILRNKCMDQLRSKYKNMEHNDNFDKAIEEFCFTESGTWEKRASPHCDWTPLIKRDQQRLEEFLEQCLQILPPKWYSALKIQFLETESKSKLHQELSLSEANFWQVVRRAKLQMRSCLENKGIEKGDLT